jgi:hypothetical protein
MAIKFLDAGVEQNQGDTAGEGEGRIFSFTQDATYIYSAIRQTHGIDLEQETYFHWWKFLALFYDLDPECFFHRIINLRRAKRKGKLTREEQEYYLRIKHIVDLPERFSPEEDEFERLLREGDELRAAVRWTDKDQHEDR